MLGCFGDDVGVAMMVVRRRGVGHRGVDNHRWRGVPGGWLVGVGVAAQLPGCRSYLHHRHQQRDFLTANPVKGNHPQGTISNTRKQK